MTGWKLGSKKMTKRWDKKLWKIGPLAHINIVSVQNHHNGSLKRRCACLTHPRLFPSQPVLQYLLVAGGVPWYPIGGLAHKLHPAGEHRWGRVTWSMRYLYIEDQRVIIHLWAVSVLWTCQGCLKPGRCNLQSLPPQLWGLSGSTSSSPCWWCSPSSCPAACCSCTRQHQQLVQHGQCRPWQLCAQHLPQPQGGQHGHVEHREHGAWYDLWLAAQLHS